MRTAIVPFSLFCVMYSSAAVQLQAQALTAAQVETARRRSENHIRFENLQFTGSSLRHAGFNLGLGVTASDPHHAVEGNTDAGQLLSIPFSEIVSIRNVGSDGRRLQLEIVHFPDISSKDLITLNPNCAQLAKYRRLVRVFVNPNNGSPLYWLGGDDDYAEISKIGRLTDMQQGITMRLRLPINQVWWAVPSILHDPLCPTSGLDPLGNGTNLQPPKR